MKYIDAQLKTVNRSKNIQTNKYLYFYREYHDKEYTFHMNENYLDVIRITIKPLIITMIIKSLINTMMKIMISSDKS